MVNNIFIFISCIFIYLIIGIIWHKVLLICTKLSINYEGNAYVDNIDESDYDEMKNKGKNIIPFVWPLCIIYTIYLILAMYLKK